MLDAEKTPPQGPFAMHLARIETKIDNLAADVAAHGKVYRNAMTTALSAEQTARTALWTRTSWGPWLVSALAFALAFASFVVACGGR